MDDVELLTAWKSGSRSHGEMLFERHYAAVHRFFSNKVNAGAEDLVQATFMACLEKVDGLVQVGSFRAFLFGIARFELLHHYRRRTRREIPSDVGVLPVHDLDPSPSRVVARSQEERLLLEALRRIPLDLQTILELSYWERASSTEIAEVLQIPVGTVKSRMRRARSLLHQEFESLSASPEVLASTTANLQAWVEGVRARL